MEVVQEKILVPTDRSRLADLRSVVRKVCLRSDVDPRTIQRVILVVDEATSNVMEHSGCRPEELIQISLEIGEETIVIEITDRGIEFDPSDRENIQARQRTNGKTPFKRGFGLHLIHLISDDISYRRTEDNENQLTLVIENRETAEAASAAVGAQESGESCLD